MSPTAAAAAAVAIRRASLSFASLVICSCSLPLLPSSLLHRVWSSFLVCHRDAREDGETCARVTSEGVLLRETTVQNNFNSDSRAHAPSPSFPLLSSPSRDALRLSFLLLPLSLSLPFISFSSHSSLRLPPPVSLPSSFHPFPVTPATLSLPRTRTVGTRNTDFPLSGCACVSVCRETRHTLLTSDSSLLPEREGDSRSQASQLTGRQATRVGGKSENSTAAAALTHTDCDREVRDKEKERENSLGRRRAKEGTKARSREIEVAT